MNWQKANRWRRYYDSMEGDKKETGDRPLSSRRGSRWKETKVRPLPPSAPCLPEETKVRPLSPRRGKNAEAFLIRKGEENEKDTDRYRHAE